MKKIPVILDTDIGNDIDDTWALAHLLQRPELDCKYVLAAHQDTEFRALLLCKMLEKWGRSDIPVGIGVMDKEHDRKVQAQRKWLGDYKFTDYPGEVVEDGVDRLIKIIMSSPEPINLICIGPLPNIAEALRREPAIAPKTHFIGMQGSIAWHHRTNIESSFIEGQIPEWNVVCDIPAAKAVFSAPWKSATITPLDTCGRIVFDGERYNELLKCEKEPVKTVMQNYKFWNDSRDCYNRHSSVLFDTVAVYLAYSSKNITLQAMKLIVDDEGRTQQDDNGMPFDVAIDWTNLEAYYDHLLDTLMGR